jgi:hypothetical protein
MLFFTIAAALLCGNAVTAAPVQVFILMGQSNMLGMGRVVGNTTNGTLEFAVHNESKCKFLRAMRVLSHTFFLPTLCTHIHTHYHCLRPVPVGRGGGHMGHQRHCAQRADHGLWQPVL